MRKTDDEQVIAILENNTDLRMKFYKVILGHIQRVQYINYLTKGDYHRTLELSGLYESKPTDLVKNDDYSFLEGLCWEWTEEDWKELEEQRATKVKCIKPEGYLLKKDHIYKIVRVEIFEDGPGVYVQGIDDECFNITCFEESFQEEYKDALKYFEENEDETEYGIFIKCY